MARDLLDVGRGDLVPAEAPTRRKSWPASSRCTPCQRTSSMTSKSTDTAGFNCSIRAHTPTANIRDATWAVCPAAPFLLRRCGSILAAVDRGCDVGKSKHGRQAVSEDEWITRYGYLLSVLPEPVAHRADVSAFGELSSTQREGLLEEVAPLLPDAWRAATSEDPQGLATLMRDVSTRRDAHSGIGEEVARRFIASGPVRAYFAVGVGSVWIDQAPLGAGADPSRVKPHRRGDHASPKRRG